MDDADGPPVHRSLPNPWSDLVLVVTRARGLGEHEAPRAFFERLAVIGADTGPRRVPMRAGDLVLGARLRLGGAVGLLGPPAHEFTDRPAALDEVWGAPAERLTERIRAAASPAAATALFQEELCRRRRLQAAPAFPRLLEGLAAAPGGFRVDAVAAQAGVTPRQLQRLCLRWVGVGPKLFARLLRFQRAVKRLGGSRTPDWHGLAAELGYTDRSHLARELREFGGAAPRELLASL